MIRIFARNRLRLGSFRNSATKWQSDPWPQSNGISRHSAEEKLFSALSAAAAAASSGKLWVTEAGWAGGGSRERGPHQPARRTRTLTHTKPHRWSWPLFSFLLSPSPPSLGGRGEILHRTFLLFVPLKRKTSPDRITQIPDKKPPKCGHRFRRGWRRLRGHRGSLSLKNSTFSPDDDDGDDDERSEIRALQ